MTKLDEMWDALAKYQSKADDRGHGESWAKMCKLRTEKACSTADYAEGAAAVAAAYAEAAAAAAYAYAAAAYAYADAEAAGCARASKYAEYCMQKAIELINKATGEIND